MDVLLCVLGDAVGADRENGSFTPKQVAMPPLGLLYLAQILSDKGYQARVYDQAVTGASNAEILEGVIKKADPHILGVSVYLRNFAATRDLVKRVKSWNPNITIIAGNYIPTFFPENVMREMSVDYCIRGEGEIALLALVDHVLKHKGDLASMKGVIYREHGLVKAGLPPEPVVDLDTLPIPDRRLVDFNYRFQRKSTTILTSRGCPFDCKFCTFERLMGRAWRARSPENVLEELHRLQSDGYEDIIVIDSNFALNKKRAFRICQGIVQEGLRGLRFSSDVRVDSATKPMLRTLASGGFQSILMGIESGNQRLLDFYKKGFTVEQAQTAVRNASDAGIGMIMASFVVGAPDETLAEAINTVKFAERLGISFAMLQILSTTPVSSLYADLVASGRYTPGPDDWKRELYVADMIPGTVPRAVLKALVNEGFVRFWSNAKRQTRFLWDTFKRDAFVLYFLDMVRNGMRRGGGSA
ncbi:MAG: radical SAM protein [Candidatus Sigynarchaeum springense]